MSRKKRVRCRICDELFVKISANHLETHGFTLEEYKKYFPNAPLK